MRGLIAVIVGAVLLIGAGYWLRSSNVDLESVETTVDAAEPAPTETAPAILEDNVAEAAETTQSQVAAGDNQSTEVFRPGTPPELLADIADFDALNSARGDAARQRIVARGPEQMPAILDALEDVVANGGTDGQYNQLMITATQLGDASHADRLIEIASGLDPSNMLSIVIFDVVDAIRAPAKGDAYAITLIQDPATEQMQLLSALTRFWHKADRDVAALAVTRLTTDDMQIRAAIYRVAFNGGLQDDIRKRLSEDVAAMEYSTPGNVTALNVFAAIEHPSIAVPQIESLRLYPSVKRAALLMSEFAWADSTGREALLPRMLSSNTSELRSVAIAHILNNGRTDLLVEHKLAQPPASPFANFESSIPGFAALPREAKLRYIDEETLVLLENLAAAPPRAQTTPHLRLVARKLGYSIEVRGNALSIEESQ